MNCRAIILNATSRIPFVLLIFFGFSSAGRGENTVVNWRDLRTSQMTIQAESSGQGQVLSTYPSWMQIIYTHILNWEPRVKNDFDIVQAPCRLSFSSETLADRLSELSQFQKQKPECIYLPDAENATGIRKIFKALSVEFDLSDTNHFRKVVFELPGTNGVLIHARGLLGLHDDKIARPLVILRMGVHGNIDEFLAERFIAKAAYEDFGFNFLALENLTSHGYLSQDNPMTFGGVDEGLQTFLILQDLRRSASGLNHLISEIHLIGVSLGAHGVFLTETLDEQNDHLLKSATVFCPVVNLIKTLNFHSQASLGSAFVDLWNRRRLKAVPERIEELDHTEWWKTFFDLKPRFMPAIIKYLDLHQSKPAELMPATTKFPKGMQSHLQNSKTFSAMNEFWPYFENSKTPLLILTTAKDILVSEEINTDLILQGKQPGSFKQIKILQLDRGTHCGLPPDYQWDFIISILKTQWH